MSKIKNFITNRFNIFAFLIFAVVIFSLYGKSLFFDWQYLDDDILILDKQDYLTFSNIKNIFTDSFFNVPGDIGYRPLLNVSFLIDRTFYGTNPIGYHITNILIFLLTIFSIYLLYSYKNNKTRSLLFSLIISIHPMLCAIVSRVVDRSDSILTLFSVLSFYFLLKYIEEVNRKKFYLSIHIILFLMVLFIKEVAIVLPIIFFVFYIFYDTNQNKKNFFLFFMWALGIVIFFICRKYSLSDVEQPTMTTSMIAYLKLIEENFVILIKYFYNLFFPVNNKIDVAYDICLFIVTFLIFLLIFIKTKYKNIKLISFAVFSFIFLFIPTMVMNNHMHSYFGNRIFLPMVCMYYVILNSLEKYECDFKKIYVWLLVLIMISYAGITYLKTDRFQNRWTAFFAELEDTPDSPYINAKLGILLADVGLYEQAEEKLLAAIKLAPYDYNHYNNLGTIYVRMKFYEKAQNCFFSAYKLNPYDRNVNYNITNLKKYLERSKDE